MSKPRIFRKKCPTCGAAFSHRNPERVNSLLAKHDCRAEQLKHERAVASDKMVQSMIQGAMMGMLGRMFSGGLGPITGPDSKGIYHAMPKGAILPPPVPGGKRTKNPLRSAHVKSRPWPVEKGAPEAPVTMISC